MVDIDQVCESGQSARRTGYSPRPRLFTLHLSGLFYAARKHPRHSSENRPEASS